MFKNDSDYLDQHFLIDEDVINKFINICNLNKEDTIVEIGPGMGTLTKKIIPKVKKVILIEKDPRLKEYLDKLDANVIYDNVLNINIPSSDKIITSLPYSIIEPFIYKLIKTDFKEIYMIMGKNYVDGVLNKQINNLSLLTNTFFNIEYYFDILPSSFNPKPKTLSSLIKLSPKTVFNSVDLIFKCLYELDDKKIKNGLMEAIIKLYHKTKKESKSIINSLNINNSILDKRFNLITNEELKELYNKVSLIVND